MPWEQVHRLIVLRELSGGAARRAGEAWSPDVDVMESDAAFVVVAELPGLTDRDFEVHVTPLALTLRGERRAPTASCEAYLQLERPGGAFHRRFSFPVPVDVDGVTAGSVNETMNRIFSDNVHLTRLGTYFMSLVTYASVYKASPQGAWAPSGVSASAARSLQDLAWSTVSSYYANPANPSSDSCKALMRDSFCATYYTFTRNPNAMGACVSHFSQSNSTNPFHFDPAGDRAYWFAAPL